MADRLSVREFLERLDQSQLLDEEGESRVRSAGIANLNEMQDVADWFLNHRMLTKWQIRSLLQGRQRFRIGSYRLLDQLSSGSVGEVFRASDKLGRQVAIKIMHPSLGPDSEVAIRFSRGIQMAARLNHPNVVSIIESDRIGNQIYVVMELADGPTVKSLIKNNSPLDFPLVVECLKQAALGLAHAHEKGMVHRDVKSANLIVTQPNPSGPPVVKILDFGLGRMVGPDNKQLTMANDVLGSPDYISPEQAENSRDVDPRTDIYSLGVVAYEMITGELPFPSRNMVEKLIARIQRDAPSVKDRRPDTPEELAQIVAKMLERRLDDRYPNPAAVAKAFEEFQRQLAS